MTPHTLFSALGETHVVVIINHFLPQKSEVLRVRCHLSELSSGEWGIDRCFWKMKKESFCEHR